MHFESHGHVIRSLVAVLTPAPLLASRFPTNRNRFRSSARLPSARAYDLECAESEERRVRGASAPARSRLSNTVLAARGKRGLVGRVDGLRFPVHLRHSGLVPRPARQRLLPDAFSSHASIAGALRARAGAFGQRIGVAPARRWQGCPGAGEARDGSERTGNRSTDRRTGPGSSGALELTPYVGVVRFLLYGDGGLIDANFPTLAALYKRLRREVAARPLGVPNLRVLIFDRRDDRFLARGDVLVEAGNPVLVVFGFRVPESGIALEHGVGSRSVAEA